MAVRVIVVMGVSGSGKTEIGRLLAHELGWAFHDADDFHPSENVRAMSQGIPLTDVQRTPWLVALRHLIDSVLPDSLGMVLACSALAKRYRTAIGIGDPRLQLVHLDGPMDVIRSRLQERTGHFMPASLLESQCALLERPTAEERAITVDIRESPAALVKQLIAQCRDGLNATHVL